MSDTIAISSPGESLSSPSMALFDMFKPYIPIMNSVFILISVWVFRSRILAVEDEIKLLKDNNTRLEKIIHDLTQRLVVLEQRQDPVKIVPRVVPSKPQVEILEDDDWDDMDTVPPRPSQSVTPPVLTLEQEMDSMLEAEVNEIEQERQ